MGAKDTTTNEDQWLNPDELDRLETAYKAGRRDLLKELRETGYSPSDKFYNAEGKLLRYPKGKLVLIPDEVNDG